MPLFTSTLFILLLVSMHVSAQTITTEPLSQNTYCADETITVNYTVTGVVNQGNAFTLQLSNPKGSFDNGFRNLGSIVSTQSGSIDVQLDEAITAGTKYRFRVIASNPRIDGADNGADIAIDPYPSIRVSPGGGVYMYKRHGGSGGQPLIEHFYTFPGDPVSFEMSASGSQRFWWNFGIGVGAAPEQTSDRRPTVTYSTPGQKNVIVSAFSPNVRCETRTNFVVDVLPTQPVLPADVRIVQTDELFDRNNPFPPNIWVCPGGVCRIGRHHSLDAPVRIYVEAGGSVIGDRDHVMDLIVYAKSGASVGPFEDFYGIVVHEPGAGIVGSDDPERGFVAIKKVASMTFDYTDVPPNGCPSLVPYTVQIKPDVRGIHTAEDDNNSAAEYWIHENGVLTSRGNGNVYYIESGGELRVQGADSKIYVKEGGMVNVEQGSGHRIFYESEGSIVNAGDGAILLPSSGITFVSQVSSVGRETGSVIEQSRLSMSPNPSTGTVELRVDEVGGLVERVEVYDMRGRKAHEVDVSGERVEISLDGYPAGVYHVRAITSKGVVTGRLVIQ